MGYIVVQTFFITEADGTPVEDDRKMEDLPCCYHGPFENVDEAAYWMNHIYPEGDTDVYEQLVTEVEINDTYLNDPYKMFSEIEN